MPKLYGYASVSTEEQNTDRQIIALTSFGVQRENIFTEKQSGKDFERPNYKKLISKLCPKDILVVSSVDRLGRNYKEIIEQWRFITREKKADIVILDMLKILDTRSEYDLIGTFVCDMVLGIISFVAEKERENIRTRQGEGIAAAKMSGVKFGRPKIVRPKNLSRVYRKWKNKEINSRQAAESLKVSHTTFLNWVKQIEGREIMKKSGNKEINQNLGVKRMGKIYGYMRVSTKEQNEDRQRIALTEAGVPLKNIFMDKQSGKDFNRPAYKKLVKKLKSGDTLIIKSIDRLGRNYKEILEEWRLITKEKGANIKILDMPLLNSNQDKDLIGTVISDIVLQLLSYVAETERNFIRQRQAEGIAAAKARGVKFGREKKERPPFFVSLREKWLKGEISAREAGRILNITHNTFIRWARE